MKPGRALSRLARAARMASVAALLAAPSAAAQDTGWVITGFRATYGVQPDGTIRVVERITVDFRWLEKHGIYRSIPIEYRRIADTPAGPLDAGRTRVQIDVEGATDGAGEEWPVETSREGDRLRIRIGDPDRTVSGRQTFVLTYTLEGGIGVFEDHDELYWQVTGTESSVPTEHASAQVILPAAAALDHAGDAPWGAECYAGPPASSSGARCQARFVPPASYEFSAADLGPGEGLTFVAIFPKGVVPGPTALQTALDRFVRYGPLAFPALALALLLGLWWTRGREPSMGSIVPVWRPPDDLRPGTAGALADQKADMDDVVATIIDLAVRGWIQIREVEPDGVLGALDDGVVGRALQVVGVDLRDWEIVRLKSDEAELEQHERLVLDGLLGSSSQRRLSKLKEKFYVHLPGIREALYANLVRRKLFPRSPDTTRKRWLMAGGAILALGFAAGIWLDHVILGLGLGASGLLVAVFSFAMPAMTLEGARRRREVEGLAEYVRRAEKAELEFGEAPEKTPEHFSAILPYAIALNVSDIWIRQFEDVLRTAPGWYAGELGAWNAGGFRQTLAGFESAASRTLAASPGSSSGGGGGGSVGGGGGGGGTGSW